MIMDAFDLADFYRSPVLMIGDALIGQMMEPVELKEGRKPCKPLAPKDWATTGNRGRKPNIINSLILDPEELERHNQRLTAKFDSMARDEVRWASYETDGDYDVLLAAYGTPARVCLTAINELKERGIKAGLFRPITLWPFPYEALREKARKAKAVLTVELSCGQMVEDVRMAVHEDLPVHFYGRQGGILVTPDEVVEQVTAILGAKKGGKA